MECGVFARECAYVIENDRERNAGSCLKSSSALSVHLESAFLHNTVFHVLLWSDVQLSAVRGTYIGKIN